MIFYDDRHVSDNQVEVYVAYSFDGGDSWEDFKVSDIAFTPAPIPGLASGYMGDYLGIAARAGQVYPVWCDNRTGTVGPLSDRSGSITDGDTGQEAGN